MVVVPRERFSTAIESLRSVLDHTEPPYELVYVDGNSPRAVRRAIQRLADEHGFHIIRSDRFLYGNEARNLGAAGVDTEFVAFVENDVLVTPGWLDALVRCADQTGAAAVGPLTLERNPADADDAGVMGAARAPRW